MDGTFWKAASWRERPRPANVGTVVSKAIEDQVAAWRGASAFGGQSVEFETRLEIEGLDVPTLRRLLALSVVDTRPLGMPAAPWERQLSDLLGASESDNLSDEEWRTVLARPLLNSARSTIRTRLESMKRDSSLPPLDAEGVLDSAALAVSERVTRLSVRTLILELHAAVLRQELTADTPEGRFNEFFGRLADPARRLALFRDYPVLARLLVTAVSDWCDSVLELLDRFAADYADIVRMGLAEPDAGLVSIEFGLGDSHAQGRTVAILRFTPEGAIVYKPRSHALDTFWQRLLNLANRSGASHPLTTPRLLPRSDYGWSEFVRHQPCHDADAMERYYHRIGGIAALLFVTNGTDFHHENVIAVGDQPVLVDVESLFHPRLVTERPPVHDFLARLLGRTALRSGLLPRPQIDGCGDLVDVSGIGGRSGQQTTEDYLVFEKSETDQMRATRGPVPVQVHKNRPTGATSAFAYEGYEAAVERGFEETYRILCEAKPELAALFREVADDPDAASRVVLRPTKFYLDLLIESYHPSFLSDGMDRDRVLDHLWTKSRAVTWAPHVIPHEQSELWRGDIPRFTAPVGQRVARSADGGIIEDVLEEPPINSAMRRLDELSEPDLARHIYAIRGALWSTRTDSVHAPGILADMDMREQSPTTFLAAARLIADRLVDLAHEDAHGHLAWLSPNRAGPGVFVPGPASADLYGGLSGIGLFFLYCGHVTEDERLLHVGRQSVHTALRYAEESAADGLLKWGGAFTGFGGIAYAVVHAASLLDDKDLLRRALTLCPVAEGLVEGPHPDITGGAAGSICCLLALGWDAPYVSELATVAGHALVDAQRPHGEGEAWSVAHRETAPLTGMSHGAAGIAYALLRLASVSGESRFREAARRAFRYERGTFDAQVRNWPDYRTWEAGISETHGAGEFMMTWCHGAPGIGLARIGCLPHLTDPQEERACLEEIEAAVGSVHEAGPTGAMSLCHGDLGNIELLSVADERLRLGDGPACHFATLREALRRRIAPSLACSPDHPIDPPGLMAGLAGAGYGFLRLAAPEKVPSVLLLDPPLHATPTADQGT